MSDIGQARAALVARILHGDGSASQAERRAAFDDAGLAEPLSRLVEKIAKQASVISDDDVAAVLAGGFDENQVFEIAVCAAVGQAGRQYDAALTALDAATAGT